MEGSSLLDQHRTTIANCRFWPMGAFNAVLGIAARVTAPTYTSLYDGTWIHPAVVPVPEPPDSGATG